MSYVKFIKFYPTTYILGGALLLLGVAFFEQWLEGDIFSLNGILHISMSLLTEIGIALFIVGSITILLEVADFQDYFLKRLTEIIIKDDYINRFDDQKKKELIMRLEQKLYFKERPKDPESFFYTVQKNVVPLLETYHYNYYEVRVQCKIDTEKGIIKKKFHRKIELVNPTSKPIKYKLPIDCRMKKFDDSLGIIPFKVVSVKVNGKPIDANCETEDIQDDHYNIQYLCHNKVDCNDDRAVIEIETESVVPIEDINFCHRVPVPCKKYSITFHLHDDSEYALHGHGFGFMDGSNIEKQIFERGMMLRFNDWILPGDGVIFSVVKK